MIPYAACERAKALVVLTEWDEFRWLELARSRTRWPSRTSSTPATCSTRAPWSAHGIGYVGIGRA